VSDRLAIRKLYMLLNISCKSGEETLKAADFLDEVASLGKAAGGKPPLPTPLSLSEFDDLQALAGNEQLLAIKSKATLLETKINECRRLKELAEQRLPIWKIIEQLTKYAAGLSEASEILTQVEAVRNGRLLLDATDRIAPLRAALADVLRKVVNDTHSAHEKAYSYGLSQLNPNRTWLRVPEPERASILSEVGLVAPVKGDISNDEALISTLEKRPLVARAAEADAVAGRVQRALELAAKYLEPKIQIISLERSTLRTEEEVRLWLEQQEKILLRAIKNGPILVN